MSTIYSHRNNPRVIIIQKLYGQFFNKEEKLAFPKHRFKKFIKDVVNGTLERDEVITDEINNHLNTDLNMIRLDKLKNILKDILKIDQLIKQHSIGNYNDQNWKC